MNTVFREIIHRLVNSENNCVYAKDLKNVLSILGYRTHSTYTYLHRLCRSGVVVKKRVGRNIVVCLSEDYKRKLITIAATILGIA
jgi:DNA-binding transcriptional regulator PaaX